MTDQITPPETDAKNIQKSKPGWIVIVVVIIVGFCLILIAGICMINTILALLGPAIGNVFSNIMNQIATPVP